MSLCACNSQVEFSKCCGPIISGKSQAKTAGALMRARYTAYTTGDIDFIVSTTHPEHKEDMDVEEITNWSKKSVWQGLEIVEEVEGGAKDDAGIVEFKAMFEINGNDLIHHERSTFEKVDGNWLFVDGKPVSAPLKRATPKIGRNDACSCGSGKKYKKCCGK